MTSKRVLHGRLRHTGFVALREISRHAGRVLIRFLHTDRNGAGGLSPGPSLLAAAVARLSTSGVRRSFYGGVEGRFDCAARAGNPLGRPEHRR
jgi:hypothetical protein